MAGIAAACAEKSAPPPRAPVTAPATRIAPRAECAAPEEPPEQAHREEGWARRAEPVRAGDTCEVADSNLAAAEKAILAGDQSGPQVRHRPWDKKSAPLRLDLVERRFGLTREERALLAKNGFVVASRLEYGDYATAIHDVYQSELPLYVSADAILHAVYASNDELVAHVESTLLAPKLARTLAAMHCALPDGDYPLEVARDLDLYLTVARSLLAGAPVSSVLGADAKALVDAATNANEMQTVELFGRPRTIDFTQMTPRGHYKGELEKYFRAAMWLARLEFNLVSRSSRSSQPPPSPDPRETPREAVDALALAEVAERSGAMPDVTLLDEAWSLLAGRREDVSLAELAQLRKEAQIGRLSVPASAEALKRAIGEKWQRTVRFHYMPEGSTVLPAIATFLGPRATLDAAFMRPLVHSETRDRHLPRAADVAYVLGHDRAAVYLKDDLAAYPDLEAQLAKARAMASAPPSSPPRDLYSTWFGAVRALSEPPLHFAPSFMTTEAFGDLRVNETIVAYGQLRHNFVLMAAQPYDEGGCEIPDAWLDPLPDVYERLVDYARNGANTLHRLDPGDKSHASAYFTRLYEVASVLRRIAVREAVGGALTADEQRYLGMAVEMSPGSSDGPPTFTGWYFDLFWRRDLALARTDFVADWFTSGHDQKIAYVGARSPKMGLFVVDAGGAPRVVVGPVARAYEMEGELAKRVDDEEAARLTQGKREPWAASYTAPAPPAPPVALRGAIDQDDDAHDPVVLELTTTRALGPVRVELLDHHRRVLASITRDVKPGKTLLRFPIEKNVRIRGAHLVVGSFHAWSFRSLMEPFVDITAGGIDGAMK